MFGLLVFSLLLGSSVAGSSDPSYVNGIRYTECSDIQGFDSRLLGWWKGRTQMTEDTYLREYDIHNIMGDGRGILNAVNANDDTKIRKDAPSYMWCGAHDNQMDKTVKVQYGPTEYGQLICIDLGMDVADQDILLVGVNQVLFTDPRDPKRNPVALNCLNYRSMSFYNSYTVWADNIHDVAYTKWTRTQEPSEGSDWSLGERNLVKLLAALASKRHH